MNPTRSTALPLLAVSLAVPAWAQTPPSTQPTTSPMNQVVGVHDPAIIRLDGRYYLFSTGPGLPIRVSDDMSHWTDAGRVIETTPEWIHQEFPKLRSMWAPDVSVVGGEVRLYYAVSEFGKRHSSIGLMTNTTLDPADAKYQWVDRGKVVSTTDRDNWNAIDAAAFVDAGGGHWLAAGSFWSGIKLFKLDAATGKIVDGDKLRSIAARAGGGHAIEGAFVTRRDGWYYLWVSWDLCCKGADSTYNTRVGRSRNPDGPYVDRAGKSLADGGGTLVLAGEGDVRGPGHISVLQDGGREFMFHHWYDAAHNGRRTLGIRPIEYDADGWPRVGAMRDVTYTPTTRPASRPTTSP